MATFLVRLIAIVFIGYFAYMVYTGDMGGTQKATRNYLDKTMDTEK